MFCFALITRMIFKNCIDFFMLKSLQNYIEQMDCLNSLVEIENIKQIVLGKTGILKLAFGDLRNLSGEEQKARSIELNNMRTMFEKEYTKSLERIAHIKNEETAGVLSLNTRLMKGSIHPITHAMWRIEEIFSAMGFQMKRGPDIESSYNNFTMLNMGPNHPARSMHDSFYLSESKVKLNQAHANEKIMLRTHTSNAQVHTMKNAAIEDYPMRVISMGRVYRSDHDKTHTPMFHQFEGFVIDKNVSFGQLKYCLQRFFEEFFEVNNIKLRLRPSFFPFTEPSVEVDIAYRNVGDRIELNGDKWLEVLGAGMIHPNVLKNCNVPSEYRGFAFGMGISRLVMLKHFMSDLNYMYGKPDRRWLQYYDCFANSL
jgi:phenylalanyl-tRNA synthetase alpha chain